MSVVPFNELKNIQPSAYYIRHTFIDTMDIEGKMENPSPMELVFPVLVLFPAIWLKPRPASSVHHGFCKGKHFFLFYLSYSLLPMKTLGVVPASGVVYHTRQTRKLGGGGYAREMLHLHLPTESGPLLHESHVQAACNSQESMTSKASMLTLASQYAASCQGPVYLVWIECLELSLCAH